jgi:hypothetical protein
MNLLRKVHAAWSRALHPNPDLTCPVDQQLVGDERNAVQADESKDRLLEDGVGRIRRAGDRLAEEAQRTREAASYRTEASGDLGDLLKQVQRSLKRLDDPDVHGTAPNARP